MDRYTKQEKAGQGTYGVVYKSLDKKDNKFVALKVTQPQTHGKYARGCDGGRGTRLDARSQPVGCYVLRNTMRCFIAMGTRWRGGAVGVFGLLKTYGSKFCQGV